MKLIKLWGWTIGVRFPAGVVNMFFATTSKPATGPLPVHWVPGAPSLTVKCLGREADDSLPYRPEVKNAWSSSSTSHYPPIRLHGMVLS